MSETVRGITLPEVTDADVEAARKAVEAMGEAGDVSKVYGKWCPSAALIESTVRSGRVYAVTAPGASASSGPTRIL